MGSKIADNFCVCEGCSVPRCLLYEMYIENCSQNVNDQVNPATFGKLVRLVFPGVGTRRLGTRGSARYHYDGIYVKKSSSFYARYCSLLSEKNYHSGDACTSGDAAGYKSNSQKKGTSKDLHYFPSVINLKNEEDRFEYSLPEFRKLYSWEQELGKKHPYELVALLADEYCSYCQDILQNVRKEELDKVEDCIISFWKSLQPETTTLMSLPDVCQLLKYYDRQLFKEMENILLNDFLEDVSIQYLKSIKLFSKNVKLWLLNALEEFPLLLQKSKFKEVTVFVKRLRRKTYLSSIAKTMKIVLNNNSKVTVLKSDLHAVIDQEFVDIHGNPFQKKFRNPDELENDIELKCLNDLIALLDTSTDIRIFLNCMSSNLQAFVIQPSKNKEEFKKLAANFQLRWNFLLTGVSKAMTLCRTVSFGSWHLFNLLLLEYVAHIFQSHLEEEGDENLCVVEQNDSTILLVHEPDHLLDNFAEQQSQTKALQPTPVTLMQSQSDDSLSNIFQSSELFGGHRHRQQAHPGHVGRQNY
ncbi:LOW QUALITY PROTEIN: DNA-binding protein RFX8 [Apteryx rowi]|uniref:LOW QUALITY PROTEIN: DNA-binding protein RFX8 n=1 Tax=Apteryx rowi TaxID=308060 RepID=UPI000E1CCE61|nr:LOW QUALITY PROTEIN: DNA-binding protein RFX8 [Apteryx rowi]